jgi:hypothetical protein
MAEEPLDIECFGDSAAKGVQPELLYLCPSGTAYERDRMRLPQTGR